LQGVNGLRQSKTSPTTKKPRGRAGQVRTDTARARCPQRCYRELPASYIADVNCDIALFKDANDQRDAIHNMRVEPDALPIDDVPSRAARHSHSRFELHSHPSGVSPHGNAVLGHLPEGQLKFRRQRNRIGQ
jgi:hypothetical protein